MPINASNAVTVAHQVRSYTLEAAGFTDSVDVLYVARMMERFMEYVRQLREVRIFFIIIIIIIEIDHSLHVGLICFSFADIILLLQLSKVLVEMGSNLMQVDDQILSLAQREKKACSSIVYSLETLAWPQLHGHAQDFTMVQTSPFFCYITKCGIWRCVCVCVFVYICMCIYMCL